MSITGLTLAAVLGAQVAPVLHYLRTNGDGSEQERVVVYVESPERVHVFKGRDRCTNAAYVTGTLDPRNGQAVSLVGGRLTRERTQEPFAWLSRSAGQITARLGKSDAPPMFEVASRPDWFMYDFDFSDWVANPPPAIRAGADHASEMVLILMADDGPTMTNRGLLELTYGGTGSGSDGAFFYYRASGPALDGKEGEMWFAAADGRLLAARLPLANHAEYRDFAYRLVKREEGEAAWQAVLADHWSGCPAD